MIIAFVNDVFMKGQGVSNVIYQIARRLSEKHEVYVIASESDYEDEKFKVLRIKARKLLKGSPIKDALSLLPTINKYKKEIMKLDKLYNFDIINVHHSALSPALVKLKNKTVVTWHGSPPSNFAREGVNRYLVGYLRKFPITISISEYLAHQLKEKKINSVVIKEACDKEFKPTHEDNNYMLTVARLVKHKRVDYLIDLAKKLSFPLHIAGKGTEQQVLQAHSKSIDSPTKFLGYVDDKELVKQYQRCSFYLTASEWEGFGLPIVEANSCAKPCIAFDNSNIRDLIKDNITGYLVSSKQELETSARLLKENKDLRKQMAKEAS